MALIRSKDTKPELRVRRAVHAAGLRYKLHDKRLPGKPDLVFVSRQVVVFVNGCFFHQHPGCPRARMPKSRQDFWSAKLSGNVKRDRANHVRLTNDGWTVLTIWECQTEDTSSLAKLVDDIKHIEPRSKRELSV